MCWPELVGGVEIEERRPRTWNEPRRKRLNFVRGHRRDSDDWVSNRPQPRRLTKQEIWDQQRARQLDQQRPMHPIPHPQFQAIHDPRIFPMPPAPPQRHQIQPDLHGHRPGSDQQDHHEHQPQIGHHGHHGRQPQLDGHSHHSEDDFIGEDLGGYHGHHGHDDHHQQKPRIIQVKPLKSSLPKGLKVHAKRSGGHKVKYYSTSSSSLDDSSSSDGSSGFADGFRAGRQSLSRRPAPRGRSRSRLTDDSFEDLMQSRMRSRSRRGRR